MDRVSNGYRFYQRLLDQGPGTLAERLLWGLLVAASRLFGLLVAVRLAAYSTGIFKAYRAGIPILSVGNLRVGGTGKTPVVDALVRRALCSGRRVAVVSRGYGGQRKSATALVSDGKGVLHDDARHYGDEPVLLARRNPQAMVIVARKRSAGVLLAESLGAEVAVLDDGFQHLALQRDLDIVLLDSANPFGNGALLPAGMLREPASSLGRADLVILTRCDNDNLPDLGLQVPVLAGSQALSDELWSLSGGTISWDSLESQRCVAFAGIAGPEGFFADLRKKGIKPVMEIALQDHQGYHRDILQRIRMACENADICLTTEKDAVKLTPDDLPIPCYVVPMTITIRPEQVLDELLSPYLSDPEPRLKGR